jgi:hypothetical protein
MRGKEDGSGASSRQPHPYPTGEIRKCGPPSSGTQASGPLSSEMSSGKSVALAH